MHLATNMILLVSCNPSSLYPNMLIILGGCICGAFLVAGVASFLLYKPWRKRVEQKRTLLTPTRDPENTVADLPNEVDLLVEIEPSSSAPVNTVEIDNSPKR